MHEISPIISYILGKIVEIENFRHKRPLRAVKNALVINFKQNEDRFTHLCAHSQVLFVRNGKIILRINYDENILVINPLFCMINGIYVTKYLKADKITLFLSVSVACH